MKSLKIEKAHQILNTVTLVFSSEDDASWFFENLEKQVTIKKQLGAKTQ